jgi:hypothetical protein
MIKMNFNPMDLIHVKEHFYPSLTNMELKAIEKFISLLIDLQKEGIIDTDLKKNLGSYFFKKQELIEIACSMRGK